MRLQHSAHSYLISYRNKCVTYLKRILKERERVAPIIYIKLKIVTKPKTSYKTF